MQKQMIIYENAVPVTLRDHGDLSVGGGGGFAHARGVHSVPLVLAEFEKAAAHYPIVFAGEGEAMFPAAILGLRSGDNLFLDTADRWTCGYVPAFLRRYPFIFAQAADSETLTLCIDTAHPGVNREGRGERLFDSDGNHTRYLQDVLAFTSDYQAQHTATAAFVARLRALDLLEPTEARSTLSDGTVQALRGFSRIGTARLAALGDSDVLDLFRNGLLGPAYQHIASLENIAELARRTAPQSVASAPADATA